MRKKKHSVQDMPDPEVPLPETPAAVPEACAPSLIEEIADTRAQTEEALVDPEAEERARLKELARAPDREEVTPPLQNMLTAFVGLTIKPYPKKWADQIATEVRRVFRQRARIARPTSPEARVALLSSCINTVVGMPDQSEHEPQLAWLGKPHALDDVLPLVRDMYPDLVTAQAVAYSTAGRCVPDVGHFLWTEKEVRQLIADARQYEDARGEWGHSQEISEFTVRSLLQERSGLLPERLTTPQLVELTQEVRTQLSLKATPLKRSSVRGGVTAALVVKRVLHDILKRGQAEDVLCVGAQSVPDTVIFEAVPVSLSTHLPPPENSAGRAHFAAGVRYQLMREGFSTSAITPKVLQEAIAEYVRNPTPLPEKLFDRPPGAQGDNTEGQRFGRQHTDS